jgi:copper chaperone CopZ
MVKRPLFMLIVIVWSAVLWSSVSSAKDYAYQGKVEGMVCAFCAYNVSKKIANLPGVDAQSVNVNLKTGRVDINSTAKIDKAAVSTVLSDSGFTLVEFKEVTYSGLSPSHFSNKPLVSLQFSSAVIKQIDSVLDAIGNVAVSRASQLSIKAPQSSEIALLKPILAGRKTVINVQFIPVTGNEVQLTLFPSVLDNAGSK